MTLREFFKIGLEKEERKKKQKKKKKKKNKNNQKERLRMKRGEKDQLEKKAQPQQDEKEEGWVVSAPCGNILCNKNAKHRCNKCKKIGFCGQECFEESGHPGRCSGRNEK